MNKTTVFGTFQLDIQAWEPLDYIARGLEPDFPYRLFDREDVLHHLAHNAAANGVTDLSELDGWEDYPRGAVTMRIKVVEME